MFAVLGWMFHASLASKMFLSLFFLFEMTREHQQLELEMFLQLLGQSLCGAVGGSPRECLRGPPCHLYLLLFISSWKASSCAAARNELHEDTRPSDRLPHRDETENGPASPHRVGDCSKKIKKTGWKRLGFGGKWAGLPGPKAAIEANQLNKHRKVGGKCSCDGVCPRRRLKAAAH